MSLLDKYEMYIDGVPVSKCASDHFDIKIGKNEAKRQRRKAARRKRASRGTISITLPREKPWHEKILVKEVKIE